MAGRLDGKVALISGAARGQGEAEARLFVAEGAKVVLGDILIEDQQKVVDSLAGQATGVKLDVTQEADWQHAVDTAVQTYGKLDILVNNAGIFPLEGLEETDLELWNRVIAINQTGVFLGMKCAVPAMREAGGGSIINISSVAGLVRHCLSWHQGRRPLADQNRCHRICQTPDSGEFGASGWSGYEDARCL